MITEVLKIIFVIWYHLLTMITKNLYISVYMLCVFSFTCLFFYRHGLDDYMHILILSLMLEMKFQMALCTDHTYGHLLFYSSHFPRRSKRMHLSVSLTLCMIPLLIQPFNDHQLFFCFFYDFCYIL